MRGRINGVGGGSKINGIINDYMVASGGNINAGDFVTYINDFEANKVTKETYYFGYVKAVELSDDRIFISHCSDSNMKQLRGFVCEISDSGVVFGTDILLLGETIYGSQGITLLDENKVLIVTPTNNGKKITCSICVIDRLEIKECNNSIIYNSTSSYPDIKWIGPIFKLKDNKIVIFYENYPQSTKYQPSYRICTVDGTTVNSGTVASIAVYNGYEDKFADVPIMLSENKGILIYSEGGSSYLPLKYSVIEGVDNGINHKSNDLNVGGYVNKYQAIQVIRLNETRVALFWTNSDGKKQAQICVINDETLIPCTPTQVEGSPTSVTTLKILSETEFEIYEVVSSKPYKVIYSFDNDNITVVERLLLDTGIKYDNTFALNLNNKIVVSDRPTGDNLFITVLGEFNNGVKQITSSSDVIFGVAKEKGTSGKNIKVYVPRIEEGE
ncbi:MAG: hypothetical protein NC483_00485 [Ruminococcus sp.]|nr:hypothetical protein [Ruminococcus sp.]